MTTFDQVRRNIEQFAEQKWDLVVIDEAHGFKNASSQRAQAIRQLNTSSRLALTGTPVENNAMELWSIIDWLNPGYLGTHGGFQTYTKLARSSKEKQAMLKPIHEVLSPIILRRTKDDAAVQLDLPDKVVEERYYELSLSQKTLYRGILEAVYTSLELDEIAGNSSFVQRGIYLKAILCMKQLCNHPDVFLKPDLADNVIDIHKSMVSQKVEKKLRKLIKDHLALSQQKVKDPWRRHVEESGKLAAFVDLMGNCTNEKGGMIIFTQYKRTATLLQSCLAGIGVGAWTDVGFLHGGLNEHQRMDLVDQFQDACLLQRQQPREGCPILILSLKAGGLGLNLTGATRVIHYDRWWNPAVEAQATDRAHRFGQDQTVFVHHFIGEDTIEVSIAQMLAEKTELAADLLGQASGESSQALASRDGFLDLVDPKGVFRI